MPLDPRIPRRGALLDVFTPHGSPLSGATDAPAQPAPFAPSAAPPQPEMDVSSQLSGLGANPFQGAQAGHIDRNRPQPELPHYNPFAKTNRQDALLAIGTGLLSHPESFAAGIGAAGQSLGQLRQAFRTKNGPAIKELGGPDNSFEVTTDPLTGEKTYAPVKGFQDYETEKYRRSHAPTAAQNGAIVSNTAAAVMRLPVQERAAAWKTMRSYNTSLGYDMGPDVEWDDHFGQVLGDTGVGARGLTNGDRADARAADTRNYRQQQLGLGQQRLAESRLKRLAPPKRASSGGGSAKLPTNFILDN